jgi:hypothetical protein
MAVSDFRNQPNFRRISLLALGLALLAQFNNCGSYNADSGGTDLYGISCSDESCLNPSIDYMSVKANLPSGNSEQGIQPGLAEFNIGGDCNEGGFALNTIRWELFLNGRKVRDSGMLGMIASSPSLNVNSRCINGRFLIYVNLNSIPEDPVNRAGLMIGSGSSRSSYDLYIEVYGQKSSLEAPQRNPLRARSRVALLAI